MTSSYTTSTNIPMSHETSCSYEMFQNPIVFDLLRDGNVSQHSPEDLEHLFSSTYSCLKDELEYLAGANYQLTDREYEDLRRLLDIIIRLHTTARAQDTQQK